MGEDSDKRLVRFKRLVAFSRRVESRGKEARAILALNKVGTAVHFVVIPFPGEARSWYNLWDVKGRGNILERVLDYRHSNEQLGTTRNLPGMK